MPARKSKQNQVKLSLDRTMRTTADLPGMRPGGTRGGKGFCVKCKEKQGKSRKRQFELSRRTYPDLPGPRPGGTRGGNGLCVKCKEKQGKSSKMNMDGPRAT